MNESKAADGSHGNGGVPAAAAATHIHDEVRRSLYAEVSREMVHLYKEQFGRGPTQAKTYFAGPDCLVCTLENSFTPAEKSLAAMGEHQRLRDTRLFFQHATEAQFCEVIEKLTGRKVRAFVSGTDAANDVSSEVFYLEPVSGAESS